MIEKKSLEILVNAEAICYTVFKIEREDVHVDTKMKTPELLLWGFLCS